MTRPARRRLRTLKEIFLVPALLGVVSAVGLVVALIGDDIYDVVGWALLAVPAAIAIWFMMRPNTRPGRNAR